MVRIAVRTLTLNVYRVEDKSMLKFIRDKTAAPYFSNLVWFIGNHVLELDACVRNDAEWVIVLFLCIFHVMVVNYAAFVILCHEKPLCFCKQFLP